MRLLNYITLLYAHYLFIVLVVGDFGKSILNECGMVYIWINQIFTSRALLLNKVEKSLQDQYLQLWHSNIFNSSKCTNYRIYKTDHKYEHYLDVLPIFNAQSLINFRMCNNHLPIEKLRWSNIERTQRFCHVCNSDEIGDEYHYLFKCAHFNELRNTMIPARYLRNINCINYQLLMNENDEDVLFKLSKFIAVVLKHVSTPTRLNN